MRSPPLLRGVCLKNSQRVTYLLRKLSPPPGSLSPQNLNTHAISLFFRLHGFHFFGCFSFGQFFEREERFVPESVEPTPQDLDPLWVHRVEPSGTLCAVCHQTCPFEYPQVLGDRGTAHVHPVGDLSHGPSAAAEAREYQPAGRISQCVQGSVSVSHDLP